MVRRDYFLLLGLIVFCAAIVQLGFLDAGLFRVTSDESARILVASSLTRANAFEPFLWPPFYKVVVGLSLKLYPSLFVTPRLLVGTAGLLSLLALAGLATQLFQDRRVSLITAALAVVAPHRLIFSIVPLSDIYYFLCMIATAMWTAQWIRTRGTTPLLLACGSLLLAESVRFETGLFAAFVELLLLYHWAIRRDLGFAVLAAASFLLFIFPVLWVLNCYLWYGSLSNLGITSQQFIGVYGRNTWFAIKWSPLRYFIQDMLWNPLTLPGLALLGWLSLRDATIRVWGLLFGLPLLALSLFMIATLSIPMAATWRTSGFWTLIILPFDAWILLRIATSLLGSSPRLRFALVAMLLVAMLPMAVRSLWFADEGLHNSQTHALHQERGLDRYLDAQLAADEGGTGVIDSSTNLDYLDVLSFSAHPERLLLTGTGDPVRIGVYVPMRVAYAGKPEAAAMLSDRFGLDHGGNVAAFRAHDVRFLAVRNPVFVAALDNSPVVKRVKRFNDWVIYDVTLSLEARRMHGAGG